MQNCVANGTEGLFGASAYGALLKTKSFVPQTIFTGISGNIDTIAWSPDGQHVAVGTYDERGFFSIFGMGKH